MLLKKILVCAACILWMPFVHAQKNISEKYEIVSAQIKPYISNSFGSGYLGLKKPVEEPGYGIFYTIKIPLEGKEALAFISEGSISNTMVCDNISIKPLLNNLYTVSTKYLDKNGDEIINILSNKISCD